MDGSEAWIRKERAAWRENKKRRGIQREGFEKKRDRKRHLKHNGIEKQRRNKKECEREKKEKERD